MNNTIWLHQDQDASCPGDIRQIMGTPHGYTIDGRYINMSTQSAHEEYRLSMTEPPSAGIYPIHTLHDIMTRMERNGEPPLTEEEIVAYYELHWPDILAAMKGNCMPENKEIITAENAIIASDKIDRETLVEYLKTFNLVGGKDGLTDNEIGQFIEVAGAFNLNPFKREVYCIPYGTGDKRRLSIITGYETYLKRAERLGLLEGWRTWTEGEVETAYQKKTFYKRDGTSYQKDIKVARGNLRAIIEIHKKGWKVPFLHEVDLSEYYQDNEMWGKMPKTMLKKVVTAQGFRLAFPDEMGGMPYSSEELPEDMTKLRDVTESHHDQPESGTHADDPRQDPPAGQGQSAPRKDMDNPGIVLMAAKAKLIKLMTTQYHGRDLFEDDDKANVKEKIMACMTMDKEKAASFLTDLATVYERKAAKIMADLEERDAYENAAPAERYEEPRENGLFDEPPEEDIF